MQPGWSSLKPGVFSQARLFAASVAGRDCVWLEYPLFGIGSNRYPVAVITFRGKNPGLALFYDGLECFALALAFNINDQFITGFEFPQRTHKV